MSMLKNRYSVVDNQLRTRSASARVNSGAIAAALPRSPNELLEKGGKQKVESSFYQGGGVGGAAPVSVMPVGGIAYNHMFTGLLPDAEESLLPYYRDCYYYDAVAGSAVDLSSNIPFSDWTLAGIDNEHIEIFSESLARLNMRSLLPEISSAYLVDGAFIGSLVYEPKTKVFQDVLIHDRLNCSVTLQPFYSVDPIITANTANYLSQFYHSNSPYVRAITEQYPKGFLDAFMQGAVVLDPVTTIYIPRRGLQNKANVSYLKRVLPAYMFEKLLFRGTLLEASKRLRATTHIQAGDDVWEPTIGELQTILQQFQMSEMDPLGAWVVTRNGVTVQDIRPAGEAWKWTDAMDQMVPYKLRALGISEAFLSADTNYSNGETAMSVFMDNMDSYRQFVTYRLFTNKIFPLIAVLRGLYKDPSKALKMNSVANLMMNLNNQKNLIIPEVKWHKNLRTNDSSQMDLLEKLTEKGLPVPLKMWAAAANVDISQLLNDMEEDIEIKQAIAKMQEKDPNPNPDQDEHMEGDEDNMEESSMRKFVEKMEIRSGNDKTFSRRRPLLAREFSPVPPTQRSKSGKVVHSFVNENQKMRQIDENIVKAMQNLSDPEVRAKVRKQVIAKLGQIPNIMGV
jgi:hypothetical protein